MSDEETDRDKRYYVESTSNFALVRDEELCEVRYYVKWVDYDASHNTWEPASCFDDPSALQREVARLERLYPLRPLHGDLLVEARKLNAELVEKRRVARSGDEKVEKVKRKRTRATAAAAGTSSASRHDEGRLRKSKSKQSTSSTGSRKTRSRSSSSAKSQFATPAPVKMETIQESTPFLPVEDEQSTSFVNSPHHQHNASGNSSAGYGGQESVGEDYGGYGGSDVTKQEEDEGFHDATGMATQRAASVQSQPPSDFGDFYAEDDFRSKTPLPPPSFAGSPPPLSAPTPAPQPTQQATQANSPPINPEFPLQNPLLPAPAPYSMFGRVKLPPLFVSKRHTFGQPPPLPPRVRKPGVGRAVNWGRRKVPDPAQTTAPATQTAAPITKAPSPFVRSASAE